MRPKTAAERFLIENRFMSISIKIMRMELLRQIDRSPHLELTGIYTHFADSATAKSFNDLDSQYEKLFATLPSDNPFQHLGFVFPDIYPPVEDAINKSKAEIDILTKAIQEGDLETIKAHLDIQISEVGDAIGILNMFIDMYNKYSAQLSEQMPQIKQYEEMLSANEELQSTNEELSTAQ